MSTPVSSSTQDPLVYRPISGFAITGFCISALYALLILYAGFRALSRGEPLLLDGFWLLLPVSGAVLCMIGQVQIRNSEGTRAGMKLTSWGLGLSICFGLGYFVYALGTGLAIRQQSNRFVMEAGDDAGFLPHLQRSGSSKTDLNAAFLLTVPPGGRGTARPDNDADMRAAFDRPDPDGNPGQLTNFAGSSLPMLFRSGSDKEIQVEPLGVMEWAYGKDGFLVRRLYRIKTEDFVADVLLSTKSSEGREGENRKWYVLLNESKIQSKEITPLGKAIEKIRVRAADFLKEWEFTMNEGKPWNGFAAVDATSWETLAPGHALRATLKDGINEMFGGTGPKRVSIRPNLDASTWHRDNGKLKIVIPITVLLTDPATGRLINVLGDIHVSTKENVGAIQGNLDPQWEITRISLNQIQSQGPKGPPPPS